MNENRIIMTINELLGWAYYETQMADGLEMMLDKLPKEVRPSVEKQVKDHRRRSRWLDEQVEHHLNKADEEKASPEVP